MKENIQIPPGQYPYDEWKRISDNLEEFFSKLGFNLLHSENEPDFIAILRYLATIDTAPENPQALPEHEPWYKALEKLNDGWNLQVPPSSEPTYSIHEEEWWQHLKKLERIQQKDTPSLSLSEPVTGHHIVNILLHPVRKIFHRLIQPYLVSFSEYHSTLQQIQQEYNHTMVQLQNELFSRVLIERQTEFNAEIVRLLNQIVHSVLFSRQKRFNILVAELLKVIPNTVAVHTDILDKKIQQLMNDRLELESLRNVLTNLSNKTQIGKKKTQKNKNKEADSSRHIFTDRLYLDFENTFRGRCHEIEDKQLKYVPYFQDKGTIIDLACGRGEFLKILKQNNIKSQGIETNSLMLEQCRQGDLDVEDLDALEYLESAEYESLGGIFCSHFIEHLDSDLALKLITLCFDKLKKGSYLIIETPNPENILVGASTFHRDPTHQRMYHPDTLQFLANHIGFSPVIVERTSFLTDQQKLRPIPEDSPLSESDPYLHNCLLYNFTWLTHYLCGPQDYAIICMKPQGM